MMVSAQPVNTQNHRITYFKRVNFVTVKWIHSTVDTMCLSVSQEIEHHYDLLNHCSFPTWTTWLNPSFCSEFCTHFTSSDRPALNIPSKIAPFACHSVSLLPCLKKLNLLLLTVYAWTMGWVSTLPTVKFLYNFSFDSLYPQFSLWGVSHLGSCSTAIQAYLLEKIWYKGTQFKPVFFKGHLYFHSTEIHLFTISLLLPSHLRWVWWTEVVCFLQCSMCSV